VIFYYRRIINEERNSIVTGHIIPIGGEGRYYWTGK